MDPFKVDGLVGTNEYIYDLPPPKVGSSVYVKTMNVYEKDGRPRHIVLHWGHRDRISYSIRRVSQKDGKDLNLPLHFDV